MLFHRLHILDCTRTLLAAPRAGKTHWDRRCPLPSRISLREEKKSYRCIIVNMPSHFIYDLNFFFGKIIMKCKSLSESSLVFQGTRYYNFECLQTERKECDLEDFLFFHGCKNIFYECIYM